MNSHSSAQSHVDTLIIGGGASGVAVLAALVRSDPAHSIIMAEKSENPGLGVAYATELESQILNVPAQAMGINPASPTDFYEWAKQTGVRIEATDFVSRQLYGRYLKDVMQKALTPCKGEVWRTDVIAVERVGAEFHARGSDNRTMCARNLVFALGHSPMKLPISVVRGQPNSRVVHNPWQLVGYQGIEHLSHILILGTGLTAMDVVSAAESLGFKGTFTLVSRRGLIPFASHGDGEIKPVVLSAEILALPLRQLIKEVRRQIAVLSIEGYDWRALIDAFRPHIPMIWRRLSIRERSQFLRHVRPYWEVVRHRMPKHARQRIDELCTEGRLQILRARINALDAGDVGPLMVTLNVKNARQSLKVDRLFNCTGGASLKKEELPSVLQSLLEQRLLSIDRFGLGIECDPQGELLDGGGKLVERCFVLGPLRRASDWESTAMREIREQATLIADQITSRLAVD